MDRTGAGVLHIVVGIAQPTAAVTEEPEAEPIVVEGDHGQNITHALAVLALPAAARGDQVVAVLVMDH